MRVKRGLTEQMDLLQFGRVVHRRPPDASVFDVSTICETAVSRMGRVRRIDPLTIELERPDGRSVRVLVVPL